MTDQVPQPADSNPPNDAGVATPAVVTKSHGVLRRSALIVLAVVIIALVAAVPLWLEPWIIGAAKSALAGQGLELSPDSRLSLSIFGVRIHGSNLKLREVGKPDDVFTATALDADVALIDSITSGDIIIESVVIDGMSGSLRRHGGRVPIIDKPDEKSEGTNWLQLAEKLAKWYKQRLEQQQQQEQKPGDKKDDKQDNKKPTAKPEPPPSKPDTDWPKSVRYEPQPKPGHWPRVLVRHLSISGHALGLPDETAFDINTFSVTGTNVAIALKADEIMDLAVNMSTKAAGVMDLSLNRKGGQTGTLGLAAKQVPIEQLNNPAIAGDGLGKYGAKGLADLALTSAWTGWDLNGDLTSTISQLSMTPTDAGNQAHQVAEVVNALKGQPIVWPMKIGGTLLSPAITDTGVEAVIKGSAMQAATSVVKDKALEQGTKMLDKETQKNPEVKKATDAAKDLFKGFGK